MTFWILLVLAGFLTILSMRYYNILFSFGGMLGWIAVWVYNLNSPPTGITVGTFLHDVLTYTFIIMAIAVMYIYFRNRGKQKAGLSVEDGKIVASKSSEEPEMDENIAYRQTVRRALHPRRRRR